MSGVAQLAVEYFDVATLCDSVDCATLSLFLMLIYHSGLVSLPRIGIPPAGNLM